MVHPAVMVFMQTSVPGIPSNTIDSFFVNGKKQARSGFYVAHCKGFSLLELLVVIVIVGILVTFTTLAIRGTDPEDLIKEEALRFNRLLQLAQEEAILKGLEYGIAFSPDGYQFLVLLDNEWQVLDADPLLRPRNLEHDIEIELMVEQTDIVMTDEDDNDEGEDDESKEKVKPQVFLLSSAEITPEFTARFVIPGVDNAYQVDAYIDGQHEMKRSE